MTLYHLGALAVAGAVLVVGALTGSVEKVEPFAILVASGAIGNAMPHMKGKGDVGR